MCQLGTNAILTPVKSQVSYNTVVWSPNQISLQTQIKRVEESHMLDPQKTRWLDGPFGPG